MYGKACPVRARRLRIRPSAVISEGGKKQLPFGGIIRCGGRLDIHVKSRRRRRLARRSEEHTSELQSLMRISYAVFCLKKKTKKTPHTAKTNEPKRDLNTLKIIIN